MTAIVDAGPLVAALNRRDQHHAWACAWLDAYTAPLLTGEAPPTLGDMVQSLRWVYNFLLPLTVPIPRTDVSHATLAGFGALPGVVAREEFGVPLVVTDHGIYLRERYIAMADGDDSLFARRILLRLTHLVSRIVYVSADQVSPVCNHNQRWERRLGVAADKLLTIYNGIDTERFRPPETEPVREHPTVVTAARVFPLKDIETLVRACDVTRRRVPDVRFVVYGAHDVDPEYTARCRALIDELGVNEFFEFAGFHSNPSALYHEGDVFALSSISEGFPFSVIEAMACARPCVATDVGGVREAVEGYGIVVPPRGHEALGDGLADLLLDTERRLDLGRRCRERVVAEFQAQGMVDAYRDTYRRLAASVTPALRPALRRKKLHAPDLLDADLDRPVPGDRPPMRPRDPAAPRVASPALSPMVGIVGAVARQARHAEDSSAAARWAATDWLDRLRADDAHPLPARPISEHSVDDAVRALFGLGTATRAPLRPRAAATDGAARV